ncbi:MAG TPA: hypothetical protein VK608_16645 [Edaphobacter sp.]|nr:hypothetical protein [Edaphobacter sp.]
MLRAQSGPVFDFTPQAGRSFLVIRVDDANKKLPFEVVSGVRATTPKSFGSRTIGIR